MSTTERLNFKSAGAVRTNFGPALIAAKKAQRERAGLKVTLTDTGWEGYFATVEARDEFVARAKAQGRSIKIG